MAAMSEREYPELLTELMEHLNTCLTSAGIAADLSRQVAESTTEHIRENFGGLQLYIPIGVQYRLGNRDKEMYERFTGSNYDELAKAYSLSSMQVRRIIRAVRAFYRTRGQLPLFPPQS